MGLLNLPIEILHNIVESFGETFPHDFESLATTCKDTYAASGKFLAKHNRLRKQYRRFEYVDLDNGPYEGEGEATAARLLFHIAMDPQIAYYIEHADFKWDDAFDETMAALMAESGDKLKRLLQESPYLQAAGQDPEEWYKEITEMDRDNYRYKYHASVFLLTLLPNVRELALPAVWLLGFPNPDHPMETGPGAPLLAVLDTIPLRANDPKVSGAALSHLEAIYPNERFAYQQKCFLEIYQPFLAINSVRRFFGGGCIAREHGFRLEWFTPRYNVYSSNLTHVELGCACIDATGLERFVSRIPALKSLRFSYEAKRCGRGRRWDAGAVMAVVEKEAGGTLEDLSISVISTYGSTGTGIVSMQGFAKLRTLELDIRSLKGPPYISEPDQSNELDGRLRDGPAVPRLVNLLPSSIESLELITDMTDEKAGCLQKLLRDYKTEKEARLPHLSHFLIRVEATPDDANGQMWKAIVDELLTLKEVSIGRPFVVFEKAHCYGKLSRGLR
ncbi:hypothetical protein B0O99DRAFT_98423 [Bisporella sp. PMI_857]|nr:hypothetical protein B0O99DRAFT_98423 [Bisporella sp. PMI_857]